MRREPFKIISSAVCTSFIPGVLRSICTLGWRGEVWPVCRCDWRDMGTRRSIKDILEYGSFPKASDRNTSLREESRREGSGRPAGELAVGSSPTGPKTASLKVVPPKSLAGTKCRSINDGDGGVHKALNRGTSPRQGSRRAGSGRPAGELVVGSSATGPDTSHQKFVPPESSAGTKCRSIKDDDGSVRKALGRPCIPCRVRFKDAGWGKHGPQQVVGSSATGTDTPVSRQAPVPPKSLAGGWLYVHPKTGALGNPVPLAELQRKLQNHDLMAHHLVTPVGSTTSYLLSEIEPFFPSHPGKKSPPSGLDASQESLASNGETSSDYQIDARVEAIMNGREYEEGREHHAVFAALSLASGRQILPLPSRFINRLMETGGDEIEARGGETTCRTRVRAWRPAPVVGSYEELESRIPVLPSPDGDWKIHLPPDHLGWQAGVRIRQEKVLLHEGRLLCDMDPRKSGVVDPRKAYAGLMLNWELPGARSKLLIPEWALKRKEEKSLVIEGGLGPEAAPSAFEFM